MVREGLSHGLGGSASLTREQNEVNQGSWAPDTGFGLFHSVPGRRCAHRRRTGGFWVSQRVMSPSQQVQEFHEGLSLQTQEEPRSGAAAFGTSPGQPRAAAFLTRLSRGEAQGPVPSDRPSHPFHGALTLCAKSESDAVSPEQVNPHSFSPRPPSPSSPAPALRLTLPSL